MQRQVADIRTRFAVVGLDAVQAAFRSTADVLGRVTRISRQSGDAAGAAGAAGQEAARRAAAAAREQAQAAARAAREQTAAAARAAAEQLRTAQETARRQADLARQAARERTRLAREAAAQAQRDADEAARRAAGARGPTPGMDPAQAAAARAAQELARQQARTAAELARQRAREYQEELRRERVRQQQAERAARQAAAQQAAAARAAAEAAAQAARQAAADSAERLRLIREEAARQAAAVRAADQARAAQARADAAAARDRIRQLRDLQRAQAAADAQARADAAARLAAARQAAADALRAARTADAANRAAARQAARDAVEALRRARAQARADEEAARARQAALERQMADELRIQRERERRGRELTRRELADIRARAAAQLRAERDAERARRDAERAGRNSGAGQRRADDQRAEGERRVRREVDDTTGAVQRQEKEAGKLAAAFAKIGGLVKGLGGKTVGALKLGAGAGLAGAAGGAGLAAGAFGLSRKATESAADYATSTYYTSLSTGLDSQTFSQLADAAKKYGLELDDLRGSLIGFQGVISESGIAGAGDPIFDALAKVGVDIGPVNGKLKTTNELLIPVLAALRTMSQTEKIGLMGKLFGEDDAGKLMPLFDELLDNPKMMEQALKRQQLFGNFINREDLKTAKEYKQAVADMSDAMRGFQLEVAKLVGPDVSRLLAGAAADLGRNRVALAQVFGNYVNNIGSVVSDLFGMIAYGRSYDQFIKNGWLIPFRETLEVMGRLAATTFRFIGELYQTLSFQDARVMEFPWLLRVRDAAIVTFGWLRNFISDAINTALFQDYNVSGAFPWMTATRDKVVEWVEQMKAIWKDLGEVWGGSEVGMTGPGRALVSLLQGFEQAKAAITEWAAWFRSVGADIALIWDQIGNPTKDKSGFQNDWLKQMSDSIWFITDAAKEAWGWFKKFYDIIFEFVKMTTGLNFESIVFFGAILTFTGTMRILGPLLAPVLSFIATVGSATAAGGVVSGLAAGFTALGTALTVVLPLLAAAAGYFGAKWLANTAVGEAVRDLEYYLTDRANAGGVKTLRQAGENMTPEETFRSRVRAGTAQMSDWGQWQGQQRAYDQEAAAWQERLQQERQQGDALQRILDTQAQAAAAQGPRVPITINVPGQGSIDASQSQDEYAAMYRQFRNGGLR